MDDILKRLGTVEGHVSDIRVQVNGLVSQIPHLATKADLEGLAARTQADLDNFATQMKADLGNLAAQTKQDLGNLAAQSQSDIGKLAAQMHGFAAQLPHLATKGDLGRMEASIIRWLVGTSIAIAGLAFAIAKFVH